MTKKPKVIASYGDPKKPKRWPAKPIRREFAKEILEESEPLGEPFETILNDNLWDLYSR